MYEECISKVFFINIVHLFLTTSHEMQSIRSRSLPNSPVKVLKQELPANKARRYPLEPRYTRHTNPMIAQSFRKHGRLDRMRAEQEAEQPILDPCSSLESRAGAKQDVVVQR
jgi:hypothetical protein